MTRPPIPVVRVIARLNIGGPAIQAISLTALMQSRGYATRLVRGTESADEGNMDDLAERMGVTPTRLESMRRDPGPGDIRALEHAWRSELAVAAAEVRPLTFTLHPEILGRPSRIDALRRVLDDARRLGMPTITHAALARAVGSAGG